jgi:hypothetical protein
MSKVKKAFFSPGKLIIAAALVVAVGVGTGHILPKVSAIDCDSTDQQDCQPITPITTNDDVAKCKTKDGEFIVLIPIPQGQHANSDGFCVNDPTPQVLGESTTVPDPTPQVLAATTTFTGK